MVTEDELKAVNKEFEAALAAAHRKRAQTIARAIDEGWAQKDVIAVTGYSRETVRRLTAEGRKLQ